ncbi:MAG: glycerol-3-phosphate 1-O-acyltransferase PlsY [Clostridia bacterium]|nr:glycerol-3-phosphate 1-O-acyltransferase PlsY [Clostridia bacterium]
MKLVLLLLIGYIVGSVPFALVIGKVFYKTDVREHGSKNLGGGNTGRVLGKKAGVAVMTLDLLKVTFVVGLAALLFDSEAVTAGAALAAAVGHCWPVFARFKGGKAVATLYGFLFGLFVFEGYSVLMFLFPLLVFLLVLKCTKIIALSSILSSVAIVVFARLTGGSMPVVLALAVFSALIVVRHKANLLRMRRREENKVSWI